MDAAARMRTIRWTFCECLRGFRQGGRGEGGKRGWRRKRERGWRRMRARMEEEERERMEEEEREGGGGREREGCRGLEII